MVCSLVINELLPKREKKKEKEKKLRNRIHDARNQLPQHIRYNLIKFHFSNSNQLIEGSSAPFLAGSSPLFTR